MDVATAGRHAARRDRQVPGLSRADRNLHPTTAPLPAWQPAHGRYARLASVRAVRTNVLASVVLAFAFIALWFVVVPQLLPYALANLPELAFVLILAAVKALVLAYLAFPFAKQYDAVAFTRFW